MIPKVSMSEFSTPVLSMKFRACRFVNYPVGNPRYRFFCDEDQMKYEPRHEKTNILVSDLVRHKPGCTATEDG